MYSIFKLVIFVILTVILAITGLLIYERKTSCFGFILDQEVVLSTNKIEGKEYTLTTLTSGWHDKVFFIKLYNTSLKRDKCNKIITYAIYSDLYDPGESYSIKSSGNKFTLDTISKQSINQFKVEWLPAPQCGDILKKIRHKPAQLKYVSCSKVSEQVETIIAKYKVEGNVAKQVEKYLVETAKMGKLEYDVYGLAIKNNRLGHYASEFGFGYAISMYPNTSYLGTLEGSDKIKNQGRLIKDYPYFIVKVRWYLEPI